MQRKEVEVSEADSAARHKAALVAASKRRLLNEQALGSLPACIDGRLNLPTKEVVRALGSPRLFQRMRCAKWIVPLYRSRDQLYPAAQILHAQRRLQEGERPPLLPSEIKQRARSGLN